MIGTIFGVIGAILTLIFGIYSIKISRRDSNSEGLVFSKIQCLSLFHSIVENIDGIDVNYQKSPISNSILLFEGKIHNKSLTDIDKSAIHSPLKVLLGDNFKILECKVSSASKNIQATANIVDNNKIILEWDLLKKNEFVKFTTLIQDNNIRTDATKPRSLKKSFYDKIGFDFRFTNVDKVNKDFFAPEENKRKKNLRNFIGTLGLLTIFLAVLIISFSLHPSSHPKSIVYELKNIEHNSLKTVSISSRLDGGKIKITSIENEEELISIQDFSKTYQIQGVKKKEDSTWKNYLFAFLGLIYFFPGVYFLRRAYNENKKIKNNT